MGIYARILMQKLCKYNYISGNGQGKPFVWGTCAGLILLSNTIEETMKGGQLKVSSTPHVSI